VSIILYLRSQQVRHVVPQGGVMPPGLWKRSVDGDVVQMMYTHRVGNYNTNHSDDGDNGGGETHDCDIGEHETYLDIEILDVLAMKRVEES
jgi:hypothetical protein